MKGHCACVATGLSSHAIARAFGHCSMGGTDHPYDPSDLQRCVDYCDETGISTKALAKRMSPISPEWDLLTGSWRTLLRLLAEEKADGRAPRTYALMSTLRKVARQ